MAKLNVRCSCGSSFTVDQAQQDPNAPVKCPSCGKALRVQVKKPAAAAEDIRIVSSGDGGSEGKSSKTTLILGGAITAIVVIGVVIVILLASGGDEEKEKNRYTGYPLPGAESPAPAPVAGTPPAAAAPAAAPGAPAAAPATPQASAPPATPPKLPPPSRRITPLPQAAPPPAANPGAPPAPRTTVVDMPPAVAAAVKAQVVGLPPYYQELCLTNPERARVARLADAKTVGSNDLDFLKEVLGREKVKLVNEEKGKIRNWLEEEKPGRLKGLPVDKVVLKDGQEVHGIILDQDSAGNIRLERLLSSGRGIMPYRKAQIKSVHKGQGLGGEFKKRWDQSTKGDTVAQMELLNWCVTNGLKPQARLAALLILTVDPGNMKARTEAGLREDPFWLNNQVSEQGGLIEFEGREWLPRELKVELLQRGFMLAGGQWYKAEEREYKLPNLLKPDNKLRSPEVQITTWNAKVNNDFSRTFKKVNVPGTPSIREVAEDKPILAFYSPTLRTLTYRDPNRSVYGGNVEHWAEGDKPVPAAGTMIQGYVIIRVDVGEPIHGGKVRILAEAKGGSRIVVWLGEGEERQKFYQISSRDIEERELPSTVRGQTQVAFDIRFDMAAAYKQVKEARIQQTALRDRKTKIIIQPEIRVKHERLVPDYGCKLFPSKRSTREVFRLTVKLGRRQPELDALFEKVPKSLLR